MNVGPKLSKGEDDSSHVDRKISSIPWNEVFSLLFGLKSIYAQLYNCWLG